MSERASVNGEGSTSSDNRWISLSIIVAGFAVLIFLLVRLAGGMEDAGSIGFLSALVVALLVIGFFFSDPENVGEVTIVGLLGIKRRVDRLKGEIDQVSKAAFRGILGTHERAHLRKLNGDERDRVHYQHGLKVDCERLEALGYLQANDKIRGLQALEDESGNRNEFPLGNYASITEDGKEYLRLYRQVAP
ncbi:hypothetical protein [Streptomyces sp. FH025]|uniref:hypothetical protein n=1 Tax=Streptomyces sp. FH025 TaxID=2815937 RepID=UPI001A9F0BBA|nr:hypothetical protein [Streptomyces sp. FH025]MBO1419842.1 hypothetical protein [Streptomyces sp. FH025]